MKQQSIAPVSARRGAGRAGIPWTSTRNIRLAVASLLALLGGCRPDAPGAASPLEQYVVFVEADYPLQNVAQGGDCYRRKHQDAASILGVLVDSLFARSVAAFNAGRNPSVDFYVLNENITRFGTSQGWNLGNLRSDYDMTRTSSRFKEELLADYENLLRSGSGTDLNDVIKSIDFIKGKKDAWFAADSETVVRVIYINDLLHYNTNGRTDAASGQFNFSDSYSLELFQHNVEQGYLSDPAASKLTDIAGETGFEVFSVVLPRCPDEPWPGDDQPDFEQFYPAVNQVWNRVFRSLGADEVTLGLTSSSAVFSRIVPGT
jgi:hypothetical protein